MKITPKPVVAQKQDKPQLSEAQKQLAEYENDALSLQEMNDGASGASAFVMMGASAVLAAAMAAPRDSYAAPARAPTTISAPAPKREFAYTHSDTMDMIYNQLSVRGANVLGMTADVALRADGDTLPGADVCSEKHNDNDWSNNFCHAAIGKAVSEKMQEHGVGHLTSDLAGAAVLFAKEAFLDKNISPSDIFFTHTFELKNTDTKQVKVDVSFNGEGAVFAGIQVNWLSGGNVSNSAGGQTTPAPNFDGDIVGGNR